jgi:carbon-monoxide dehydrogenase medium subunit
MKPAPFSYHRATSVEDAVAALAQGGGMARILAGGQSLVPMLNLRLAPLDTVIDIGRVESLKQAQEDAASVRYGSLITHAAFEDKRVPDGSNGLMPFVGGQIAYRAVRNRGTIGGAIALADPAADWLTTLVALEAKLVVAGPGNQRTVAAADFVIGSYLTDLAESEMIEAIVVPRRAATERWGHYKVARKTGEYAESMAIALIDKARGTARVVVGATDGAPLVLDRAGRAFLDGQRDVALHAVIRDELMTSGREFSAARLTMHTTVAMRGLKDAAAK